MKLTKLFTAGLCAAALFATGCADNTADKGELNEGGEAALKISLKTQVMDKAAGTPSMADENLVNKFTVYVFHAETEVLEATETFVNTLEGTMSGLSTGFQKKIVVIANAPSTFPVFYEGDDYEKFTLSTAAINISNQTPANISTNGLVMFGETETPVTLNLTGTTTVPVTIKRLVARVRLGEINILPKGNYEEEDFEVTGVSIQRAYSATDIFGNKLSSTVLYGGLTGSMSVTQPYFYDAISADFEVGTPETFGNYFYVLPNQNYDECTLLTLITTYEGVEQYLPIRINTEMGNDNTDGTMVLSNKSYVINITINNLGEGTTDPDLPPTEASIKVDVTVEDWALDIVQNVVW